MRNLKKWVAVAGAGLAVLMLTVVALPASAAGTVSAPVAHRGGPMGGGANDTYLAEALGITAAELQTACRILRALGAAAPQTDAGNIPRP